MVDPGLIRWLTPADHAMCCICFQIVHRDQLVVDGNGETWDVCRGQCAVEAGFRNGYFPEHFAE